MQKTSQNSDLGKLRVLVVDDDPDILSLILMILQSMGIRDTERAMDGEAALEFFRSNPWCVDFVICDWIMPKMNGLELFAQVRNINPNIPFMMLTSKSSADAVRTAVGAGVSYYIAKPFTQETLKKKVLSIAKEIFANQK